MLRQKYGLTGAVNVDELTERMGLRIDVRDMPAEELHEITIGRNIAVSSQMSHQERRWTIAHAIVHWVLHPGNHVWLRSKTSLAIPYEREAESFAYGVLVDDDEVLAERLGSLVEVAAHFGVPMHVLWENGPQVGGQVRLF